MEAEREEDAELAVGFGVYINTVAKETESNQYTRDVSADYLANRHLRRASLMMLSRQPTCLAYFPRLLPMNEESKMTYHRTQWTSHRTIQNPPSAHHCEAPFLILPHNTLRLGEFLLALLPAPGKCNLCILLFLQFLL